MSEKAKLPDKREPDDLQETEPDQGSVPSTPNNQVESAFRKLVESKPEVLAEFVGMSMTSVGNPLYQKMTPEHITQVIDLASKHDERQYNLHTKNVGNEHWQWIAGHLLAFVAFLVIVTVVIIVLFLFQDKPDVLIPTLTGVGGFLSGLAGGWGLGGRRKK